MGRCCSFPLKIIKTNGRIFVTFAPPIPIMDYYKFSRPLDGLVCIIISLLLASIQLSSVIARPDFSVSPVSAGRNGPFETCVNATSGEAGRCMFAMDCFRARGRHVGICTKGFYFGSCCSLPTYSSSPADHNKRPGSTPLTTSRPPTPSDNLPRVPIVLESNAIDGPAAFQPSDPLDLSFWPDLLADIYGLKPQPINSNQFPYSTFHAPSKPASNQHVNSAETVTVTTTSSTTTNPITIVTNATTSSSTSLKPTTSTLNPWAAWLQLGNTSTSNVTVIVANVTAMAETEAPAFIHLESWLEEVVEPTTSIPTTTIPSTWTSTSSTPTPPTMATTVSSAVPTTNNQNITLDLIPSSLPGSSSILQRDGSIEAVCGKPVYRWPKIVSGENARLGQWPWQVTLQEKTRRGYSHKCGASLISKEWVVTAAHCLINVQPENLLVRMGGIDFASVEDRWIESRVQIFQHPQFSIQTQQNDVALLKLQTPLVAFQSNVLPICLPDREMEFDGAQSFVSGWGRLGEKSPISTRLQYVGVPIINNTECENIYRSIKHIDRNLMCAGYAEGLKDSCEGDSGGPMMVFKRGRWVLAGIISWGVGCARPNQPGVSTRVTEFLDWIQSTLVANSLPT